MPTAMSSGSFTPTSEVCVFFNSVVCGAFILPFLIPLNTSSSSPHHAQELQKIGEALKDEKFREMLAEYAKEISDPATRAVCLISRGGGCESPNKLL